ncbi:MAG TPA: MBL fold metallo-hydrolase [Patescibacteria group bacterium]|nr:MBL fold metallo-hydrolase [Patescibacteria group bacterium]
MHIRLIRNATMRLTYNGRELLLDPFLAPSKTLESFAGISPNPLVDLPCPAVEVLAGAEAVLLSHLHIDHFDPLAQESLAKDITLFCQPGDEKRIAAMGFSDIRPIMDAVTWQGIRINRCPGRHGSGALAEQMGQVSGFVFRAAGQPTLYWAGDTVWYDEVQSTIERFRPIVIITHSSGAKFGDSEAIVMDAEQTIKVCQAAPQATIVAIHMESLDHGKVSRADLRKMADNAAIRTHQLLIPADGERILWPLTAS